MQGSQEGKHAKLWGPRAHFGANILMKIASSCSEYSLQDYCFLSTTIDSYWLLSILLIDKIFFWDLDFYRFLISIDFNQRIKSINTDDIDWFPISIFIDYDHQHTWTSYWCVRSEISHFETRSIVADQVVNFAGNPLTDLCTCCACHIVDFNAVFSLDEIGTH